MSEKSKITPKTSTAPKKAKDDEAELSADEMISVRQAADLKEVTRSAVYKAVHSGRLPHRMLLGHIGLSKKEVLAWNPIGHRAGRPKGTPVSAEAKKRMAVSQKRRWARVKAMNSAEQTS